MAAVLAAGICLLLLWHARACRGGRYSYAWVRGMAGCLPALHMFIRLLFGQTARTGVAGVVLGLSVVGFLVSLLCSLRLMRREGWHPRNLQSCLLCLGLTGLSCLTLALSRGKDGYADILTGLLLYAAGVLISSVVLGVIAGRREAPCDRDAVLILGSQIREDGTLTPLLRGRADRALAFARREERETGYLPLLVPTGGQGADEPLSEGEAIGRYLLSQGYPRERILQETRATGTVENLRFSRELLCQSGISHPRIAFATSDFHVLRTGVLAREAGMDAAGIGSPTRLYFWVNAYAREILVMLYRDIRCFLLDAAAVAALEALSALL